jgi:hypothetical protein
MIQEALDWSLQAHMRESERNASLHMQERVMYAPICAHLQEAVTKVKAIRLQLIEDGQQVEP